MKKWLLLLLALVLSGCAFQANYKADYLKDLPMTAPYLDGQALIYTDPADDSRILEKSPSSLTGYATTLKIPLGKILKNICTEVFNRKFRQGALPVSIREVREAVVVMIHPTIVSFDYRYNSLRNVGFAITPEVRLSISVTLYDRHGKYLSRKDYESDYVSGDSYLVSLEPAERINQLVHQVLTDLVQLAATDADAYVMQVSHP